MANTIHFESKPTARIRLVRALVGLALSFLLWMNFGLILMCTAFLFSDDPLRDLKKVNWDVPAVTALLSQYFSIVLGGTLSPVLCAYTHSRMKWMIFGYSLFGAAGSFVFSNSLAISAMLIIQNQVGNTAYRYAFVTAGVTGVLAGFLGGYFASLILNRRLKSIS